MLPQSLTSSHFVRAFVAVSVLSAMLFIVKSIGIADYKPRKKTVIPDINVNTTVKSVYFATTLFGLRDWQKSMFFGWKYNTPVKCPHHHHQCQLTHNSGEAHALVFHGREIASADPRLHQTRRANQRWIFLSWESVVHARVILNNFWKWKFNWTATYLPNSDIPSPFYLGYNPLNASEKREMSGRPLYNASEKSGFAFAVVSNCWSKSRNDYFKALKRFMKIDMYGKCGQSLKKTSGAIMDLSRRYRYYLAFENSVCRDYMTEKFWLNGLQGYAVPVVNSGFSRNDYAKVAPPNSFIYGPDFTGQDLAKFLTNLAKDESKYAKYFEWKKKYKVDNTGTDKLFFCRLCHRLHTDLKPSISDVNSFWVLSKNCKYV